MPESSAVRSALGLVNSSPRPSALQQLENVELTPVREVLEGLAERDRTGEMLTAIRHFPAREAQWAEFPAWAHADLIAAYASKGIRLANRF